MTEFSLRIFLTDYYLTKPIPHVDINYNEFTNKDILQVPIIRIFGTTPKGQKVCAHIHGVFPYFYVPYMDDMSIISNKDRLDRYLLQFATSLNEAIKISMEYSPSNSFIFKVVLVKGKQFYGYQGDFQYFLKIYLYNPMMIKRAAELLQSGSVLNKVMQPYETHISYNLKFFIDYNLYGMNFLFTDAAKFRLDKNCESYPDYCGDLSTQMFVNVSQKVWNAEDVIFGNHLMDPTVCYKMSCCELEVDISACDILNILEVEINIGQNPGLKNLWDEEKQRRIDLGLDLSDLVGEVFEERPLAEKSKSEKVLFDNWQAIAESVEPLNQTEIIDQNVNEFLNASQSDGDYSEEEFDLDKSINQEFILKNIRSNTFQADQNFDDDEEIQDFIYRCMKEEDDSILTPYTESVITNQHHISNPNIIKGASFSQVTELKHEPLRDECIELESDTDSEELFNKTFIDLSLNDDSENESTNNAIETKPQQNYDVPQTSANNGSSEDLFEDIESIYISSSDTEDIEELKEYDGADDDNDNDETLINDYEPQHKMIKTEIQNANMLRSPIVTRSQNKRITESKNILIPYITKKMKKERQNKKNRSKISLKLKNQSSYQNSMDTLSSKCESSNVHIGNSDNNIENKTSKLSQVLNLKTNESNTNNKCDIDENYTYQIESNFHSSLSNNINANFVPDVDLLNLTPPSTNNFISTPMRLKTKTLSQQFHDISPISKSFKKKPSVHNVSFSIPEISQEFFHESPSKLSPDKPIYDQKVERLKSYEEMKKSLTQNFHNMSSGVSLLSPKLCETCHLTLLSGEIFSKSNLNLKPNPKFDEILMFFYAVHDENDIPDEFITSKHIVHKGVIYVDDGTDIMRSTGLPKYDGQNFVPVSNETELMDKIIELVWEFDPDILLGFETTRASWGYLLERSFNMNHKLFHRLSRLLQTSDSKYTKNVMDSFKITDLHCTGRMIFDLWILLKYEVPLNSYTLENCANEILKERVPFYSNQQLLTYYRSNMDRHILMDYFYYRVLANIRFLTKLNAISRISEFARIYGIEFYHVLSRGSQFRVESMMLRLAKPQNLIAISPSVSQRAQQKAPECIPLTLEPKSGFYKDPIVVLDFQSLYPSIMIAYNYCYASTLGKLDNILSVDRDQEYKLGCCNMTLNKTTIQKIGSNVSISPNGVVFVQPEVEKGIISKMVEEILNTRIMVKKSMKIHAENKSLCKLLDARQLGLKLIANVTFGYTAAGFSGRMPCVDVGESIIRKSRETLEETIKLINSGGPNYIPKSDSNGGWDGCRVIYGDTDSVFILMPKRTKDEAFKLGARIADYISSINPFPVKLKFEKVYQPCLLEAKKRYVGYAYESPDQKEPKFDAKGIETVRRDNCKIVSKILERSLIRLFTSDIESVKRYVTQQLDKITRGDINIFDFIIAKEYHGRQNYKSNSCVPALHIAREVAKKDPRAEPLYGERVPYIIIQGAPGDTLISCVRQPEDILFNTKILKSYGNNIRLLNEQGCKLSYTYYITKQILPPLNRALTLVGVDVFNWYSKIPKRVNNYGNGYRGQCSNKLLNRTISSYFQSRSCLLCNSTVKPISKAPSDSFAAILCETCNKKGKFHIYLSATKQLRDIEECKVDILAQCFMCTNISPTNRGIGPPCISKDCPTFFERIRAFQKPTSDLERLIDSNVFL